MKKFRLFYENKLITAFMDPATGHYPKPDETSSHPSSSFP
jgi:hypothetical protein